MPDTLDPAQQDDAPLTASKRSDAVDRATEELIEPKGDALNRAGDTLPAARRRTLEKAKDELRALLDQQ